MIFPSCGASNDGTAAGKPPLRRGGFPAALDSTLFDRSRVFRQLQTGMREDIMIRWSRIAFGLAACFAALEAKTAELQPGVRDLAWVENRVKELEPTLRERRFD